jgi:hypothetical protein
MTWPLPDLPKLPPAPTREERRRERQAQLEALEADEGSRLPRGVTRLEDGSFHVPYWRRDDLWIIGGMIFAFLLLVAFLAYWTTGAPAQTGDGGGGGGGGPGPEAATEPLSPFWWAVGILIVVFMVAIAAYVGWALVTIFRGKGVRYEDVSAEEQARRRDVARLLKQVEPAVSIEDAERQLGHIAPQPDPDP